MSESEEVKKLQDRGNTIAMGCEYRSHEHQLSHRRWYAVATTLAAIAAFSSTVAGASLLSSAGSGSLWWYIAGTLGVIGGASGSVNLALGTQRRAEEHRRAAAAFGTFRMRYRDIVNHPGSTAAEMSQAIQALNAEKADVEMGLPLPEAWAKKKVEERRQQNIENQKRRAHEELAQGR